MLMIPAKAETTASRFRRALPVGPAFFILVVLPTLIAAAYFALFASDVFVSEARFVVRSAERTTSTPFGGLLLAGGLSGANEENYAVVDYMQSMSALDDADRDGLVRRMFGDRGIFVLDRFGGVPFMGTSREHLRRYMNGKVGIDFDTSSQVTKLTVHAYSARDARLLNERLLEQSELLVNRLNERGRRDAIAQADVVVEAARRSARTAIVALARFRNASGILDPEKQAMINLQMVSKLQDALVAEQTQLTQLQVYTPDNPQIPAGKTRIASLRREIDKQASYVAGSSSSLSGVASRYQQLVFDADFAAKQLGIALAALQEARNEANRKQVYLERIASPNLPDYPTEPRRLRNTVAVLILSLLTWGVVSTLTAGIKEHRD